ncbi:MAG: hypothetical protein P4L68_06955 [Methylovirgula sp.]|nr:hypothetical protein [Methylovirgula sp.]
MPRIFAPILMLGALILCVVLPARGDEVPFAQPAPSTNPHGESNTVALSDIMQLTQLRHMKLWYAGKAKNWPLANYELVQLRDTFSKAAMLYLNIPVQYIAAVSEPLTTLGDAVTAKDSHAFEKGYKALQVACNACHQAADIGFIVIQTPTTSVFPDQKFSPSK